jgi:nitroreductase
MISIEDLNSLIKNRRALYPATYTGETVPDDTIRVILENANWAPNHKNTEPWRFIIFKDEKLAELGEYLAEYYKDNTPPHKFSSTKYNKTLKKTKKCSHILAICMKRDDDKRVPEWEEIAAVACSVQNMWLTCTVLKLGCYWSTPKAALEGNAFFELEDSVKCLGLFYIGVTSLNADEIQAERGPLSAKIRWV